MKSLYLCKCFVSLKTSLEMVEMRLAERSSSAKLVRPPKAEAEIQVNTLLLIYNF